MRLQTLPVSVSLAVVIGAVNACLMLLVWLYTSLHLPLLGWLVSHGLKGSYFHGVMFAIDLLAGVLTCIPAAFLLCKLRPARLRVYVLAALVPGVLLQYRAVIGDISSFQGGWALVPPVLLMLLPLPAVAFVVRRAGIR